MRFKHRLYLKLNLVSIFFIVVSFISVTLAWFAYSGLAKVSTDIGVKAWYIELDKDGQAVSDEITISLSDIYPGMKTSNETIDLKNLGDSDAQVSYSIVSARILGDTADNYTVDGTSTTSSYVEDAISHNYPFHINMNLSKSYILSKGENSSFQVSVSWPLDSDEDSLDSLWGSKAYAFQQSELTKKSADSNYQVKPSIQVVIKLQAEQYLTQSTTSDPSYNLGDTILYDVANNKVCTQISSTCMTTYVIDVNNTLGDGTVTLLPSPINDYTSSTFDNYSQALSSETSTWTVPNRALNASDILNIISTDVINTNLIRPNISNLIVGDLRYTGRINTELARATSYGGYYSFLTSKFGFLTSNNCYWTSTTYDATKGFAVKKQDDSSANVYGEANSSTCNVIPVIIATKSNLKTT